MTKTLILLVLMTLRCSLFGNVNDFSDMVSDLSPVQVSIPSGTTITAIACGFYNGYALDSTDHFWAWEYGYGATNTLPYQVSNLPPN